MNIYDMKLEDIIKTKELAHSQIGCSGIFGGYSAEKYYDDLYHKTLRIQRLMQKYNMKNSSELYDHIGDQYNEAVCSKCGGKYRIRLNSKTNDLFLGCDGYPVCQRTMSL